MHGGDVGPSVLPSRRGFGRSVAAGGLFTVLAGTAVGDEGEALPAADALLASVRASYGKHLNAEKLQTIRRSLVRGLIRAEEMKRVALTNADDPACAFRADLP